MTINAISLDKEIINEEEKIKSYIDIYRQKRTKRTYICIEGLK